MKNIRFIFIWAFLCFCLNVEAQLNDENIYRPFINKVSVHPETGMITIAWNLPAWQSPPFNVTDFVDTDEFVIHWFKPKTQTSSAAYIPFDSVLVDQRTYEFDYDVMKMKYPEMPDPRKTSVGFSVTAIQKAPRKTTLQSVLHHNLQVSNDYDSCRLQIKLNWHRYQGWSANTRPNKPLVSYNLMSLNGGVPEEVKVLTPDDTTWTVKVEDNNTYIYYIEARRDGETATSYATIRTTDMPVAPAFINAESTQYNNEGFAEVSFKIDQNAEMHRYNFRGSRIPGASVDWLGTYDIYGDTILTDIKKRDETYYYRLEAQHTHECRGITATSNTATALWLNYKQNDAVNVLRWEPYQFWGEEHQHEDVQYDVYRQIGDADPIVIVSINVPDPTAFDDDMMSVLIDGDVCYWVVATPKSYSPDNIAISNKICIKPESNIFIPEAFTPNVAGINSEFKPFFSYPPREYMLFVYDLNGAKVFETKDIEAGWNGRLVNGKPASEGVYVYYLKFRTERGRLVEKKGTFALVALR